MPLVLDGTNGVSGVDGTASNPSYEGTDSNTGIFYPAADTVAIGTNGTEALRVNSSQNVGIGTSLPATMLNLSRDSGLSTGTGTTVAIRIGDTGQDGGANTWNITQQFTALQFFSADASGVGATIRASVGATMEATSGSTSALTFFTNSSGTPTERARITSTGNFVIGTTNTANYGNIGLYVSGNSPNYTAVSIGASGGDYGVIGYNVGFTSTAGTYKAIASDGMSWIRFTNAGFEFWRQTSATGGTNYTGTQGMTLTNGGALLVGGTALPGGIPLARFYVEQASSDYSGAFYSTSSTAGNNYGVLVFYQNAAPNNTSNEMFIARDNAQIRFQVRSNGGIANYQANNVNLSDRREKTNFAPAKNYLDVICAIPVQTFNYVDQNMEEDGGETLGVVAQDVKAVAPELVTESNWAGKDEEPKMRLSIYQTDLQYALMKCIQELNTKVEALEAQLKGNA